jgi:ribosomal-protein-alanine N-acetyltransferase
LTPRRIERTLLLSSVQLGIFDRFPLLTTPRLVLREPEPGDAPALLALRADEEVNRFQIQPELADEGAARAQIARWRRRFQLRAEIRWVIASRDDGAFVGTCTFAHFVPALDRGHLAYEICRPFWGRGLATEALAAMVAFGHGEAGLDRIEAVVMSPGNEASARVLHKVGFAEEGLLRAYAIARGAPVDMRMFSILRMGS